MTGGCACGRVRYAAEINDHGRGLGDLTVASFDDPSRFRPVAHSGAESLHEAWLDTSALPRHVTKPEIEAKTRAS